jgi:hypothetical protein
MSKHRTAKGREFNMQAFSASRGTTTAVGNAPRNARGDMLGAGGKIVATAQEIANKFHDANMTASTTVNLNPSQTEIKRREVVGIDGITRTEVTYSDGSVEYLTELDARNTNKEF